MSARATRRPFGSTGTWNPRRSLVARLLWYVVPVALVPAAVYWVIGDRIGAEQRESLLQTLIVDARRHEARTLSEDAADRVRAIGARKPAKSSPSSAEPPRRRGMRWRRGRTRSFRRKRSSTSPDGLLRSPGRGVSAAMVSRQRGLDAEARRDLAATRRLEAPFVALGLGPVDLSALSIRTASGVLRVVPGLESEAGRKADRRPEVPLPERAGRPARRRDRGNRVASASSGPPSTKTRTPETGTSCRPWLS